MTEEKTQVEMLELFLKTDTIATNVLESLRGVVDSLTEEERIAYCERVLVGQQMQLLHAQEAVAAASLEGLIAGYGTCCLTTDSNMSEKERMNDWKKYCIHIFKTALESENVSPASLATLAKNANQYTSQEEEASMGVVIAEMIKACVQSVLEEE